MTSLLTLISSGHTDLSAGHLAIAERAIDDSKIALAGQPRWLSKHKAAQFTIENPFNKKQIDALRDQFTDDKIDVLITSQSCAKKKLLIADMDSTIVTEETLDEIAKSAGFGEQVSAITTRAMNGELDFAQALTERVKMLEGKSDNILKDHLPRVELTSGAKALVGTMAAHGATCVLVSGGFTFFTGHIAEIAGFHHHHGNTLGIEDGILTGKVIPPILDKNAKYEFLQLYMNEMDIAAEDTMTIGDGANDYEMLKAASFGIGFHPKPLLIDELDNLILHGDLTAALYAQGYSDEEFAA